MKHYLILIGIVLVSTSVIVASVVLFFPHTLSYIFLFHNPQSQIDYSVTNNVPEQYTLTTPPENYQYADTISAQGITLSTPWEIIEEKDLSDSTFIKSENQNVLITDAYHLQELSESIGNFPDIDTASLSDYDVFKMVMDTRREDIIPFDNAQKAARDQVLILLKIGIIPPFEHTAYAFQTDTLNGYMFHVTQENNKASDTSTHRALLFFEDGSINEIFFNNTSQEDVDYILSSVVQDTDQ